ncbi:hypothetical protein SprV_0100306600 [Sparganum proliferum]
MTNVYPSDSFAAAHNAAKTTLASRKFRRPSAPTPQLSTCPGDHQTFRARIGFVGHLRTQSDNSTTTPPTAPANASIVSTTATSTESTIDITTPSEQNPGIPPSTHTTTSIISATFPRQVRRLPPLLIPRSQRSRLSNLALTLTACFEPVLITIAPLHHA